MRGTYHSVAEIRHRNEAAGRYFFSPDSMHFFRSRICEGVYGGRYFVTSERAPGDVRRYTVRVAAENGSIGLVGAFGAYDTREAAIRAAKRTHPCSCCNAHGHADGRCKSHGQAVLYWIGAPQAPGVDFCEACAAAILSEDDSHFAERPVEGALPAEPRPEEVGS